MPGVMPGSGAHFRSARAARIYSLAMRRYTTSPSSLFCTTVVRTQTPAPIRGFIGASAAAEREAEETFRAVPKPDNLREYMRTISAEPHHAGSPASRKVADYVLAKFKSWGLDAKIEEFEALMPYPTERVVELVGPEHYTPKLAGAAGRRGPRLRRTPASSRRFNAYSADGDVTAELVYVNYGIPEDYEQLAKLEHRRQGQDRHRALRPQLARHQAEGGLRARRGRLHHLLRSARRRLLPGRRVSRRAHTGPSRACSAAASWTCRSIPAIRSRPGWASEPGGREAGSRRGARRS